MAPSMFLFCYTDLCPLAITKRVRKASLALQAHYFCREVSAGCWGSVVMRKRGNPCAGDEIFGTASGTRGLLMMETQRHAVPWGSTGDLDRDFGVIRGLSDEALVRMVSTH